jgi:hypothetical protein
MQKRAGGGKRFVPGSLRTASHLKLPKDQPNNLSRFEM